LEPVAMSKLAALALIGMFCFACTASGEQYQLSEQDLQRYTGDFWEADEAFAAEVRVIDGRLWAVHSPTRRNELVPVGPDRFEMIGMPATVIIDYTMDDSGIIEMRRTIDGQARGRFTPFAPHQLTAEQLSGYVGDYLSVAGDSHYLLSLQDGKLVFSSEGQAQQELNALFGETFEHPDVGSFIFSRNADGLVTGFLLRSRQAPSQEFRRQ